ncbi:hypothetical protein VTN77DRAFT_7636 [Rasamsonia byssochlamydoides]|uniref:uncharacterized protein n=1 Tax=Rasamsonia byssochlamydoides TaxID=89139 RepID=UPI00374394F3
MKHPGWGGLEFIESGMEERKDGGLRSSSCKAIGHRNRGTQPTLNAQHDMSMAAIGVVGGCPQLRRLDGEFHIENSGGGAVGEYHNRWMAAAEYFRLSPARLFRVSADPKTKRFFLFEGKNLSVAANKAIHVKAPDVHGHYYNRNCTDSIQASSMKGLLGSEASPLGGGGGEVLSANCPCQWSRRALLSTHSILHGPASHGQTTTRSPPGIQDLHTLVHSHCSTRRYCGVIAKNLTSRDAD